jgi:hypothetical protein
MQNDLIANLPDIEKKIFDELKQHNIKVTITMVDKKYCCRARHPVCKIDPELCYGDTPGEALHIINNNVRVAWSELFEDKEDKALPQ